jgi:hypothetical protein
VEYLRNQSIHLDPTPFSNKEKGRKTNSSGVERAAIASASMIVGTFLHLLCRLKHRRQAKESLYVSKMLGVKYFVHYMLKIHSVKSNL